MRGPVDLEKLSESLLNGERVQEAILQLPKVQESDLQAISSSRTQILRRCLKFLQSAASSRKYAYISPILKFVCSANFLDEWLVSSSSIILPKLNNLYCTILAEVDPGLQQSPGKVNVAISPRVKRDRDAMRALCSVFEVCVTFCDLVDEENQQQLGIFLRTSAAVLFGSDFQKKRATLNETDYVMDELARYSSYALSNIMLTYPAVVPMAEAILGKRLHCLFRFLHSSPEMSINRSLILMLRSLYRRYENDEEPNTCRGLIDAEFSYEGPGRRDVLFLFQEIELASEDAAAQAENVSMKMHTGENKDACFKSVKCSVQVKEENSAMRCRVPFRCASIDWNRNSFVLHKAFDKPECWPFFLVSNFGWRKGRNELHLQLEGCSERSACRIIIRFSTGSALESEKDVIQDRLKEMKTRVQVCAKGRPEYTACVTRKVSHAAMKGTGFSGMKANASEERPAEGPMKENESAAEEFKPSVGAKHILSIIAPHRVYSSGSHLEDDDIYSKPHHDSIEKNNSSPVEQEFSLTPITNGDSSEASSLFGSRHCIVPNDDKMVVSHEKITSPGAFENLHSPDTGSGKARHSGGAKYLAAEVHIADVSEENVGQTHSGSSHAGFQASDTKRHIEGASNPKRSNHQPKTAKLSIDGPPERKLVEEMKVSAPYPQGMGEFTGLIEEDNQIRQKLQSVVAKMLQWKRTQLSKVHQGTKLSITKAKERCEKQDHEFLTVFGNGVRKRSALHTRKVASWAGQAREILLKTRKRLSSLREKLMDGQQQLKILKTASNSDIASAKNDMQGERDRLRMNLEESVAATRRRGESRARKNSVLQSLARLLKH